MATQKLVFLAGVAVTLLASAGASPATASGDRPASPHRARACNSGDLAVRIATNGAGGGLTPGVAVHNRGSRACRLDATLTFTIQDRRGRARPPFIYRADVRTSSATFVERVVPRWDGSPAAPPRWRC